MRRDGSEGFTLDDVLSFHSQNCSPKKKARDNKPGRRKDRWSCSMSTALLDYVQMLQNPPELPSFEPELDDLDQKKYGELQ